MTESTVKRRRRREDLFRPLVAALAAALLIIGVLTWSVLDIASTAHDAATTALENTDRLDSAERGFCNRLQTVRDATNRNGAIIYVVLDTVADNVAQAGRTANEHDYRQLADLPRFQPSTDCVRAIADPANYQPQEPVQFKALEPQMLSDILAGDAAPTVRRKP